MMTEPNDSELRDKVQYFKHRLAQSKGRKATEAELAAALEMTIEELREIEKPRRPAQSEQECDEALEQVRSVVEQNPAAMRGLSPRERTVIRLRLGLEDGRKWSEVEVAESFAVVARRIRRITMRAIYKLKLRGDNS